MIEKIPSGKWRVRVYHRGKCVATQSFDLKKDATVWEGEQKRRLLTGGFIDPRRGDLSFSDMMARYFDVVDGALNPKTFDTDQSNLRKHLEPRLGHRPVGAITSGELDNLFASLVKDGLARSTVSRIRDSAATTFNWAVRQEFIDRTPVLASRVPSSEEEHAKWLGHSTPTVTLNICSHYVRAASDNAALGLLRAQRGHQS